MTTTVQKQSESSRYEISVDGAVRGFADYEVRGDVVVLPHTVIDRDARGQGLAAQLVAAALDDIREQGLRVVPACSYVASYIADHPDQQDLLAD